MIFSEWDEAWTDQDPQKENEIKDTNTLFLLDIVKSFDRYVTDLEKEYGTKAAELAKIPYHRFINYVLDTCEVGDLDIKVVNNRKCFKNNIWKEKILHNFVIVK